MKIAANITLLFCELPLLARFMAARRAGFDGVEIQFPYSESPDALRRAVAEAGIPVVLMNAPVGTGVYAAGIAGRPEMRDAFRSELSRVSEYADALDVRFVHVLAGRCDAGERARCRDTYVDNISFAAAALAGRQILIEVLNPHDVPDYLIGSLEEAQAVLARCTAGLQFDVYHVARMGLNPAEEFEKIMPAVRHVQFADAPGRHEPGSGKIQFETVLQTLECAGYDGWLGAEYRPAARTTDGLEWLAKWRRRRGRLG